MQARYACTEMADIQKRQGYTPRRTREQRAFRMVKVGSVTGVLGVGTLVLAIAGVVSAWIPILLIILTAVAVFRFMTVTGQR
jgi:hypothetical protein